MRLLNSELRLLPPRRLPGRLPGLRLPGLPRATPVALIPLPAPIAAGAEVATVVPAVAIAVEVVVALTALPVVTPPGIPELAGTPVIRRERTRLSLGGTRREPEARKPHGDQRARR